MKSPFLTLPTVNFKKTFLEGVQEFLQEETKGDRHDRYRALDVPVLENFFESFIQENESRRRGENVPHGYVPETTWWLIDRETFIGSVSVRHWLNERLAQMGGHIGYDIRPSERGKGYGNTILALALHEAKNLDISEVLLTCDETNIGSQKVIVRNGGVFDGSVYDEGKGVTKFRYRIALSQ